MELSVLVQQTPNNRFRAWCAVPVVAEAEGATRDEALAKLTSEISTQLHGAEVARVVVGWPIRSTPIWPDDEITRAWLDGIAAARAKADQQPDPWDAPDCDPPGTLGDEQSNTPEAIAAWAAAFDAIPPLAMTAVEEAEWKADRLKRKNLDAAAFDRLVATFPEPTK